MPLPIGEIIPSFSGMTASVGNVPFADTVPPQPILVQFWAISCPICKRNLPKLNAFLAMYQTQGLQLVSVHMPRMESDMDVAAVKAAVEELELIGPCTVDNNHSIGDRFQTGGVWPCYFLFDAEGKLRCRAAGALGLKMAENSLRRLLELQEVMPSST